MPRRIWNVMLAFAACMMPIPGAMAQQEPVPSQTQAGATTTTTINTDTGSHTIVPIPLDAVLDLSSTVASIAAPIQAPATINAGGTEMTVNPGQLLTPAQFLAVRQVIGNWGQNLILDANGAAIGGSVGIGSASVSSLASLVLPSGVSITGYNFNAETPLNVLGTANIAGTFNAVQTAQNVAAVMNFGSLNILQGGMLTSALPTGVVGNNVFASSGLNLNVINNVVNQGTIATGGVLNINAGGSITNGLQALISAQSLNLFAGSGMIFNQGLVQATNSLNLLTSTLQSLSIVNLGTMKVLDGAINIGDSSTSRGASTSIAGGDWLSRELNIHGGSGHIIAELGQVSGTLNSQSAATHLYADTANLNLGSNCTTGDPTFANTGNITISGANSFAEAVSIVAGGNISLGNGTGSITTTGTGNQVIMISGATVNLGGNALITDITGSPAGTTINGASATLGAGSGNIDLATGYAGSATVVRTTGGNVTLLANNGIILLPTTATWSVDTSNTTGSGGNVTLIAGSAATGSSVIQAGNIRTSAGGSGATSGSVVITAAAPQITNGGGTAFFNTNGSATTTPGGATASTFGAGVTTPGAQITSGNVLTAGGGATPFAILNGANAGSLRITAGGAITTGSLQAYGGGGAGCCGGVGGTGGKGNQISVVSTSGPINILADVNASGGGGGSGDGGGGSGGAAGAITISTPGTVTIAGPVLSAGGGNGGSASGGGGSFGGGGGGDLSGGGGGGIFGGSGGDIGSGGGAFGGGVAQFFFFGGSPGVAGAGGTGFFGGSSGGSFGDGGAGNSPGADVGSAAGGAISITGSSVNLTGTVGSFYGFAAPSSFDDQSANATGAGGSVTINGSALGTAITGPYSVTTPSPPSTTSLTASTTSIGPTIESGRVDQLALNLNNVNGPLLFGTIIETDQTPVNRNGVYYDLESDGPDAAQLGEVDGRRDRSNMIAMFLGANFDAEQLSALMAAGISTGSGSGDNRLNLDRGRLFVAPTKDIIIATHDGDLQISAGAMVFVIETGHDVAIYDLTDNRKGQVKFVGNNHSISLSPGEQLVLTHNSESSFAEVNPGFKVGFRNIARADFGNGITAHIASFPLISVMAEINNSTKSTGFKLNQLASLNSKLLKTAAAIQVSTAGRGAYTQEK